MFERGVEKVGWMVGLLVAIGYIVAAVGVGSRLPPVIPLFYSLGWGVEQLAPTHYGIYLLVGNLLWYGANTLLAWRCSKFDAFLGRVVLWANVLFSMLIEITILRIWLIFLW